MSRIKISLGEVSLMATLNDSSTARLIQQVLPLQSRAQLWGQEVYFTIPVEAGQENPRATVESGAVAYWPPGRALCLFFGQQPYSPVNIVGHLEGDPCVLSAVRERDPIRVETA